MLIDGLRQKKLIIGISAIAIVACVIGAMILLTNPVTDASDDKEQISGQVSEETNTLDGNPDGNKLDAIYYKDTCYYGLAMSRTFQKGEEPEGFAYIGKLVYIVDRYQSPIRNLNATIGEVGDDVYHYVDEKGFHYFCIPIERNEYSGTTKYLTISKATATKPDYYTSGEEADAKGGIYYRKNSETEIAARYLEGALYAGSTLFFNGKIYQSSNSFDALDKSDLGYEDIVDKELGTILSNHYIYWAVDGEKLHEVTDEGTLYSIKGYDEDFRVGILYARKRSADAQDVEYIYYFDVYKCLNDITLFKGEELFKGMYHLDDTVRVECSLMDSMTSQVKNTCEVPLDNNVMMEFMNALCEGKFIDPMSADFLEIPTNTKKDYATVRFYDSLGLTATVSVYEKGFVTIWGGKDMRIAVDAELCEKIIALAGTKEAEVYTGTLKLGATELSYTGYRKYDTLDYTIDIQDAENTILQTLEYSYDLGEDTPTDYGIFSKDVNQDGCEDILLKLAGHGNIGPVWACFVYDKKTDQFVQVEGFEELPGVEITDEIRSYYTSGGGVYYRLERYLIVNNALVLEGRLEQEIKENDLGEYISCQEEHYEDGRIVYQKKNISVDEIDMNFWNQDIGEGLNKN